MSAFLSHKYKLIYPHIPRTGGTSLTEAVIPHLGAKDISDGRLEKHQSFRIIKIGHPKEFAEYVKFAVVRDPFDRIASLHQGYNIDTNLSRVVEKLYYGIIPKDEAFFWPMKNWLCSSEGEPLYDIIFRFETDLPDKITAFLKNAGIPVDNFPHVNKGKLNDGKKEYYEQKRKECKSVMPMFREHYSWDYAMFGYE